MKNTDEVGQAAHFLDKYMDRMIGGKWWYSIKVVPSSEMALATNGGPAMISTRILSGERRLLIEINKEIDWKVEDMEQAVVHELVHCVSDLFGFDTVLRNMLKEFAACNPIAQQAYKHDLFDIWEELIDRLAVITINRRI